MTPCAVRTVPEPRFSGDAATLARDAQRLIKHGYRLGAVHPIDLAPQTYFIDSVAVLERLGVADPEDLVVMVIATVAVGGAVYPDIDRALEKVAGVVGGLIMSTTRATAVLVISTLVFDVRFSVEQWGLVVNEAMAAGLPVLVSRACGCAPDLVREGVNGFTFDPYDVGGLAGLMVRMSSGELNLKTMGEASQVIIAGWTPEVFGENLLRAVDAARGS